LTGQTSDDFVSVGVYVYGEPIPGPPFLRLAVQK
jgi:hypothetical protein